MIELSSGTLIEKVKLLQLREHLTDGEMAGKLGCSRQLYQMTRSGRIPPGNKILRGLLATFPELEQDVIYFLSNDDDKSYTNATKNPLRRGSEAQERGLKRFFGGLLEKIRNLPKILAP